LAARDSYIAIADPTRRSILELLRDTGPMRAGDIATSFGASSRPGISRHLRILRECGVVTARRSGKEWRYTVEPGPLAEIRDGFLASFGTMQSESLRALRRRVERDDR
jgi:DNA-binding transcriptional ArsR family regulator